MGKPDCRPLRHLARGADAGADAGERALGVVAQRGDRSDADHDDQGEHHGVLDGGRAVFLHEEIGHAAEELAHVSLLQGWKDEKRPLADKTAAHEDACSVPFRATLLNVPLALLPSVVIAAMQTTMIRASITAYSTAVGPSSARKNSITLLSISFSPFSSLCSGPCGASKLASCFPVGAGER